MVRLTHDVRQTRLATVRPTASSATRRPTRTAAAGAVLVLALSGCTSDDGSSVLDAVASTPICQAEESSDSCLDGVRLSLQSAFVDVAEQGTVTTADYERVVSSVVSQARLGDSWSYELLTEPAEGVEPTDAAGPTQFTVAVRGAVGTWWMCPADGRVSAASCDEQR